MVGVGTKGFIQFQFNQHNKKNQSLLKATLIILGMFEKMFFKPVYFGQNQR